MITARARRRWRLAAVTAALAAAGAWFASASWRGDVPAAPVAAAPLPAANPAARLAAVPPTPRLAAPPAAPAHAAAAPPPGVSADEWARIEAELAMQPDGAAELRRLAAYLAWSHAARRWRDPALPAGERGALAAQVEAGLDERLRRREVSAAEARLIKAALLESRIADDETRAAALARWQAAQPGGAFAAAQADARQAGFAREQAALVTAWSARPAAQRDPAALEAELEALRRARFASPNR